MAELPAVTLYGKPDCHLCDEAEDGLARLSRQRGISYRKVDIQSSAELYERLRYRIPVIEVEGGATLDWPVTSEQVWTAVRAAARP
jgi:glutaredoxin